MKLCITFGKSAFPFLCANEVRPKNLSGGVNAVARVLEDAANKAGYTLHGDCVAGESLTETRDKFDLVVDVSNHVFKALEKAPEEMPVFVETALLENLRDISEKDRSGNYCVTVGPAP